jgi:6,7-dimethyl-8-ribityllumazine synthase
MTDEDRSGAYNPFEDTGDWPFRESTAPPVQRAGESEAEPERPFDLERLEPLAEPEPEPAADSEPEPEPVTPGLEPEPDFEPEREPAAEVAEPEPEPVAEAPSPGPELEPGELPFELGEPPERFAAYEPPPEPPAAPGPRADQPAEQTWEPEPEPKPQPEHGPTVAFEAEPAAVLADPVEAEEEQEDSEAFEGEPGSEAVPEPEREDVPPAAVPSVAEEHAPGELRLPEGPEVLEGVPNGFRRTVAIVVSRFNADITNRLLEGAVEALVDAHVNREAIAIVPVPGAFELPLAAMAVAKTRRFSCVVALGCVIRGETPHFDFVAGEAASGLQLAAIETGVPVSFGLLTVESLEQAEARIGKGAEVARAALEMADLFTQVRTRAARSG